MEYTQLGRTGLKVSRLVLGTMNFGPQTDEADSHAIMDSALDAGVNFFDTANVYGWGENKGRTEEIIGSWFAKGGGRRDKTVLATKVYGNMAPEGSEWPNYDRLSALNIRRAVDASLKRLGTDHIDLYQFHHVDRHTPWEEIWQAIDVLIQQGKILYAGSSNFAGWHIARASEAAAAPRLAGPGQRAVPVQPGRPRRRDGGRPGGRALRPGGDPVVAAQRRPARRRAAQAAGGRRLPVHQRPGRGRAEVPGAARPDPGRTRTCATSTACTPVTWAWPGC